MEYTLNQIGNIRRTLGITQAELASMSGVSQSLIAKIEAKSIDPTFTKAQKIFNALYNISRKEQKKIKEVMNKRLVSLFRDETIEETIKKMKQFGISQLPVLDKDNNPVGYISETILLEKLLDNYPKDTKIEDIMLECPPIITEDSSIEIASNLLKYYPIVLINKDGRLRGIVTKSDIITNLY